MNFSFNAAMAVLMAAGLCACQSVQTGTSTHSGDLGASAPVNSRRDVSANINAPADTGKTANRKASAANRANPTRTLRRSGRGDEQVASLNFSESTPSRNEAASSAIRRKPVVLKTRKQGTSAKVAVRKGSHRALVSRFARKHGVPVALAHAVVRVESNYRASARGSAGEVGLMQIKPATARGMGYRGSRKALYNPATNLDYGMRYLAAAYRKGGRTTCGTILKYNAGHGAKRMNRVSRAYCGKVQRILRQG